MPLPRRSTHPLLFSSPDSVSESDSRSLRGSVHPSHSTCWARYRVRPEILHDAGRALAAHSASQNGRTAEETRNAGEGRQVPRLGSWWPWTEAGTHCSPPTHTHSTCSRSLAQNHCLESGFCTVFQEFTSKRDAELDPAPSALIKTSMISHLIQHMGTFSSVQTSSHLIKPKPCRIKRTLFSKSFYLRS